MDIGASHETEEIINCIYQSSEIESDKGSINVQCYKKGRSGKPKINWKIFNLINMKLKRIKLKTPGGGL